MTTLLSTRSYSLIVVASIRPSSRRYLSHRAASFAMVVSAVIACCVGVARSTSFSRSARSAAAAVVPVAVTSRVTPSLSRIRVRARYAPSRTCVVRIVPQVPSDVGGRPRPMSPPLSAAGWPGTARRRLLLAAPGWPGCRRSSRRVRRPRRPGRSGGSAGSPPSFTARGPKPARRVRQVYSVAFGIERYAAAWSMVRMPPSTLLSTVVLMMCSFVVTRTGLSS